MHSEKWVEMQKAVKENRSMMIFPQGTRVKPGISSKEKPYLPGVFFLYSQAKVPVIPVAHNAGLLWPKNSFLNILIDLDPNLLLYRFFQK